MIVENYVIFYLSGGGGLLKSLNIYGSFYGRPRRTNKAMLA